MRTGNADKQGYAMIYRITGAQTRSGRESVFHKRKYLTHL